MNGSARDEGMFAISIAAKLCQMHPQTLRMYERLGLVTPRRVGRNRLYSASDIERLRQIQRLTQDMGVNLAGVEVILGLLDRMTRIQAEAEARVEEMRVQFLEELQRLQRRT